MILHKVWLKRVIWLPRLTILISESRKDKKEAMLILLPRLQNQVKNISITSEKDIKIQSTTLWATVLEEQLRSV